MDILKRISRKWWMFWLAILSYCGLNICNVLSAHFTSLGREGFHNMDSFDYTMLLVNMCIAGFTSIRSLMNKDYHNALNGNDKAGTENAGK